MKVTSLPGACACINALTVSGLPTRRFAFEAFLPHDKKERAKILEGLKSETRTIIIYEAPHHLKKTLALLQETLGDRRLTVCRELTKRYEDKMQGSFSEMIAYYQEHEPRGEYVLVIEGKSFEDLTLEEQESWQEMSVEEHVAFYEGQGMDRKAAMKQAARDRGVSKRDIYQVLCKK